MIAPIDEFKKELTDIAMFAPSTVDNYVACMTAFFDYARRQLRIDPVFAKGKHILDWIGQVKNSGVSKSRMEHHRSSLRLFFALMVKLNIVVKNPADKLPQIRRTRTSERNRPVAPAMVFKLLASIDRSGWRGIRDHLIIAMLWALGLRVSELTALKVVHFEPDHDGDNRIGLLRVRGKNKKQRALFVVDNLYDELVDHLEHLWSPVQKNVPIFPIDTGTAISNDRVRKMIKERCRTAGITQRITPHVLRHCFATDMYHAGVPLDDIQTMLGHDHKAETAVYVHVSDKLKKQALEQIGLQGGLSWA
ncbi:tyrosine-type recombinase/integrase [Desulfosarcina ovata]|uniref:Tyrosine recombinase XerC n=1 Tax=Desulfosarcina ovata subsp. ovata TaxID=2752305 RepID=A0A5K8A6S6_9BACT|nr:tyrosine-type recombinase/integrase [Desulfosarcina ovata]BBO88312.1 tyrosine recombinase XerC [Desulfosarcina ovata subsp. ovata]